MSLSKFSNISFITYLNILKLSSINSKSLNEEGPYDSSLIVTLKKIEYKYLMYLIAGSSIKWRYFSLLFLSSAQSTLIKSLSVIWFILADVTKIYNFFLYQ